MGNLLIYSATVGDLRLIEPQHLLGECHLASRRRFKGCLVSCWAALGELPGARRDGNTI